MNQGHDTSKTTTTKKLDMTNVKKVIKKVFTLTPCNLKTKGKK